MPSDELRPGTVVVRVSGGLVQATYADADVTVVVIDEDNREVSERHLDWIAIEQPHPLDTLEEREVREVLQVQGR